MVCTACTEPQCLYSRPVTLLPLSAVLNVQTLSACTIELYLYSPYWPYGLYRASVPVQESYNSTPPIGHTACAEPQCLKRVHFTFTLLQVSAVYMSHHLVGRSHRYFKKKARLFTLA